MNRIASKLRAASREIVHVAIEIRQWRFGFFALLIALFSIGVWGLGNLPQVDNVAVATAVQVASRVIWLPLMAVMAVIALLPRPSEPWIYAGYAAPILMGIMVIFIMVGTAAFWIGVVYFARRRLGARWIHLGLLLVVVLALIGVDIVPKYIKFMQVCREIAGLQVRDGSNAIREVTIGRPGTGCDVYCRQLLLDGVVERIEIEVERPRMENLATQPGWHRFYMSYAGAPECDTYRAAQADRRDTGRFWQIPKDRCVASEIVPKPAADFRTFRAGSIDSGAEGTALRIATLKLVAMSSDLVVAQLGHVGFSDGWEEWLGFGDRGRGDKCPGDDKRDLISFDEVAFIRQVKASLSAR